MNGYLAGFLGRQAGERQRRAKRRILLRMTCHQFSQRLSRIRAYLLPQLVAAAQSVQPQTNDARPFLLQTQLYGLPTPAKNVLGTLGTAAAILQRHFRLKRSARRAVILLAARRISWRWKASRETLLSAAVVTPISNPPDPKIDWTCRIQRYEAVEILSRRRTRVVRIFPNAESGPRRIRPLCVENHETWLEDSLYFNVMLPMEEKKGVAGTGRVSGRTVGA